MTNAIVLASEVTQITTAADSSDDMLVELFIRTKRSEKTRVQYAHSTGLLRGFVGKPLASMTLQDAVDYHTHLKGQYSSLHSIKLHINVAKALCAFGVKLNYLRPMSLRSSSRT